MEYLLFLECGLSLSLSTIKLRASLDFAVTTDQQIREVWTRTDAAAIKILANSRHTFAKEKHFKSAIKFRRYTIFSVPSAIYLIGSMQLLRGRNKNKLVGYFNYTFPLQPGFNQ
jgi:hypothetical protein